MTIKELKEHLDKLPNQDLEVVCLNRCGELNIIKDSAISLVVPCDYSSGDYEWALGRKDAKQVLELF